MRAIPFPLAAALLLSGCGEGAVVPPGTSGESTAPAAAGPARELPSLVLVTADTLRRDHLGCYGYPRPTSPVVDALAEESLVFESVVTPMAVTLPSHMSIFTGLYPSAHGFVSNRDGVDRPYVPEPGRETVAIALRRAGYRTGAFVSAPPVGAYTGIDAGFDVYDDPGNVVRADGPTTAAALAWLEGVGEGPFFLWVHLWSPHEPNEPPEPYASMFAGGAGVEAILDERGVDVDRLTTERVDAHVFSTFFGAPERVRRTARSRDAETERRATAEQLVDLVDRYDACVRIVDDQVARLIEALRAAGRWDRTVFVFTADHGQCLGDRGWLGHGPLFDANVLVPLVVRFPPALGVAPGRLAERASTIDLLPTVLGRFDAPELAEFLRQVEGVDLLAGEREPAVLARGPQTGRNPLDPEAGPEHALLSGEWKLTRRSGRPDRLYDLRRPVPEREDESARHPELAAELGRELDRLLARRPPEPAPGGPEDPDAGARLEALRKLGYADAVPDDE